MGRKMEYAGKRYGDLEVIERAGTTPSGAALLRCVCHRCGRECIVEGQRLTSKRSPKRDCGCRTAEKSADLTGERHGGMDVLRREGNAPSGDKLYLCRCIYCGREKLLTASTIRKGPQSCGCLQYQKERMAAMSEAAGGKRFADCGGLKSADRNAIHATKATARSKTGVRGVFQDKDGYRAAVQVAGERWIGTGYKTIERAKADADKKKQELLEKYGLKK